MSACSRVIIFLFFPVKAVSPGVYFSGPTGAFSGFSSPVPTAPDDEFTAWHHIVWGDVAKPPVTRPTALLYDSRACETAPRQTRPSPLAG
jgi:hypothetical protein